MFILIRVWATKPLPPNTEIDPHLDITSYLDFQEAVEYLKKWDTEKVDVFFDWLEQNPEIGGDFRFNNNLFAFINMS